VTSSETTSSALWSKGAGLIVPAIALVLWEMVARSGAAPDFVVAPTAVVARLAIMAVDGDLWLHLSATMFRALAGFAAGSAVGILLGLGAGASRGLGGFFDPLISLIYPVPKVAFLPILVIWLGIGDASKIATIALSVFFPAFINAYAGARMVDPIYVWAAKNMGASRTRIFFLVTLPASLPQILAGLRIGLGLSFVVVFAAELFGARAGLGYLIGLAEDNRRYDLMFVAIIMIGAAGFVSDRILLLVRRRLLAGQSISKEEFSA
jgi:NitT/TauT family transport system permease protein